MLVADEPTTRYARAATGGYVAYQFLVSRVGQEDIFPDIIVTSLHELCDKLNNRLQICMRIVNDKPRMGQFFEQRSVQGAQFKQIDFMEMQFGVRSGAAMDALD